ncbi:hypothetical protein ABZU86_16315 [Streptomyces sp. NPDC005271]|uniref:hypothetical protein n=1 Tax=unclassified Streptomyces TaxID=2593676 RepID=UPI0033B88845
MSEMNEAAKKVDERLTPIVREIGEYESGRKKCDKPTLLRNLLRLRRQELETMRDLQRADPSFRPDRMTEGISNIEREINDLEHSWGLSR